MRFLEKYAPFPRSDYRRSAHSRKAETLIGKGLDDAVAFGRDWIANLDLVARLQRKAEA